MRFAILGCGSIGRRHLRNLSRLGDVDLIAYDPVPSAAANAVLDTSANIRRTLDEVWSERPDAVLITSTPDAHVPLAIDAALHGVHLFIEKPLSHNEAGLDKLKALAKSRGLVTMVGCNMRFHPGPATVWRMLQEGAIGRPLWARIEAGSYLPGWRPHQDYRSSYSADRSRGGGVLLDYIHEIDLALWYGGPASLAHALTLPAAEIGLEVDGMAELLLTHPSGQVSSVHINYVQPEYHRACRIAGTAGMLEWDWQRSSISLIHKQKRYEFSYPDGWELNDMYLGEMRHFVQCVAAGTPTICSIEDGAEPLSIAFQAEKHH